MPLEAFSADVVIAVVCSLRAFLVVVCASEQAKRGTGPAGLNARRLASRSLIMPRARAKRGFPRGPVGRCSGLSWSWQQPRALGVGCWNERVLSVRKRNPAICACLNKRVRLSRGALSLPPAPCPLARALSLSGTFQWPTHTARRALLVRCGCGRVCRRGCSCVLRSQAALQRRGRRD